MNQSELEANTDVARAKRGKMRASKSRLVLVLLLIGRGSGARLQSVEMQNQSNCGITFNTQLKSALNAEIRKQGNKIAKICPN